MANDDARRRSEHITQLASKLEFAHKKLNDAKNGDSLSDYGIEGYDGYKIVDAHTYPGQNYYKAIVIEDGEGNIHIHHFGTGDGNWAGNHVNYDDEPSVSDQQRWSADFFEKVYNEHCANDPSKRITVSGHSQGGNTAQYVIINSEHGDAIEMCVTISAPSFSTALIDELKRQQGEDAFLSKCEKIWSYDGDNDFVSALGQECIVPEGQRRYIELQSPRDENGNISPARLHDIKGYINENGEVVISDKEGAFREFARALNESIKKLPPHDQPDAALYLMKVLENGDIPNEPLYETISKEEFDKLKKLLALALPDFIANNADLISEALEVLELDPRTAQSIENLVKLIATFPPEYQKLMLEEILDLIDYSYDESTGKGGFSFDWTKLPTAIAAILPLLKEAKDFNPEDLSNLINSPELADAVEKWAKEHPLQVGAATVCAVIFGGKIYRFIKFIERELDDLGKFEAAMIRGVDDSDYEYKGFIMPLIRAAYDAIKGYVNWYIFKKLDESRRYAAENTEIIVDTSKLRDLAQRVANVNMRLNKLDDWMNSLWWQVGLLDIYDVIVADLITAQSGKLSKVWTYLDSAASYFMVAENRVIEIMGG